MQKGFAYLHLTTFSQKKYLYVFISILFITFFDITYYSITLFTTNKIIIKIMFTITTYFISI